MLEGSCLVGTNSYDHVYYDEVTDVSLPINLCEGFIKVEVQVIRQMNVCISYEKENAKEQDQSPIGTRRLFTNKEEQIVLSFTSDS